MLTMTIQRSKKFVPGAADQDAERDQCPSLPRISSSGGMPSSELPYLLICWASLPGSTPCRRLGGKYSSPGSTSRNSGIRLLAGLLYWPAHRTVEKPVVRIAGFRLDDTSHITTEQLADSVEFTL